MTALSKEQLEEIDSAMGSSLSVLSRDVYLKLRAHIDALSPATAVPRVCYGPAIAYPLAVTAHEPYVPYNKPVSSDETCDALEGMALLFEEGRSADIEDVAIDYLRDAVARLRRSPATAHLREALSELLEVSLSVMPSYEDGLADRDAWLTRRDAAREKARLALLSHAPAVTWVEDTWRIRQQEASRVLKAAGWGATAIRELFEPYAASARETP